MRAYDSLAFFRAVSVNPDVAYSLITFPYAQSHSDDVSKKETVNLCDSVFLYASELVGDLEKRVGERAVEIARLKGKDVLGCKVSHPLYSNGEKREERENPEMELPILANPNVVSNSGTGRLSLCLSSSHIHYTIFPSLTH